MYFRIVKTDRSEISGKCDRVKFVLACLEVFDVNGYIIVSIPIAEVLSFVIE